MKMCVVYLFYFIFHSHGEVFVPRGCARLPHGLGLAWRLTVNAESKVSVGLRAEQTPRVLQLGTRDYNTRSNSVKQTRAESVTS